MKIIIITGSLVQDHEFIYPFYRLQEDKNNYIDIALKNAILLIILTLLAFFVLASCGMSFVCYVVHLGKDSIPPFRFLQI